MNTSPPPRPRARSLAQVQAALDRALAKSDEMARAGNLPRLLHQSAELQVWTVASRTTGGAVYRLEVRGAGGELEITCECDAHGWCWHRTHVERALLGEIGRLVVPPSQAGQSRPQSCRRCGMFSSAVLAHPSRLCPACAAPAPEPAPEPVCRRCGEIGVALEADGRCRACAQADLLGRPRERS